MIIHTLNVQADLTDSLVVKKLLDYFLISDYSQTYLYTGHVSSLKYILQEKDTSKVNEVITEIEKSLTNLYKSYFSVVEINVSPSYVKDTSLYNVTVDITVQNHEGLVTSLNDFITLESPYDTKHIYELKKIKI